MRRPPPGRHVEVATAGERFRAFVPAPLAHLERLGIVAEITNRRRGRVLSYRRHVDELTAGVEEAP
jgi:hypothetical protein